MGQFPSCSCGSSGSSDIPLVACDGTAGEDAANVHVCNEDPIDVNIVGTDPIEVTVEVGSSVEVSNDVGNPIPVTDVQPDFSHGQNSDIDSGANEQIVVAPNPAASGVLVKALTSNTGTIYIGGSGVSSANGFPLEAGDSVTIPVDDANKVYAIASIDNQALAWIAT